MKKYVRSLVLVCAVPLTLTGCASTQAHRTVWEYKVIQPGAPEKMLNELGAQGWEVVTEGENYIFVLKRPREQD